jgi:NAD(P)-dependent dehydrogenase (short-subunit alcohol dehydrogenase family)
MDKKIVISGVSQGLGYQLAEKFCDAGYSVAGCSRSGKGPGGLSICEAVDVSDFESVEKFARKVMTDMGVPYFLVNNAALMNKAANLWEIDPEAFSSLINTNVTGTFNMIKAFFPAMAMAKSGIVVNFSSGWGRTTSAHVAPYCASKYAVEGMSMAMAKEVPAGMAVVSLNPGFIDTDMAKGIYGEGSGAESPESWVKRAASFILNISPLDNGRQLTVV